SAAQLGAGPAKAAELSKVAAKTFEAGWGDSFDTVNLAIKGVVQNIGDVSKSAGGMQGVTQKVLALSQTFDQDLGGTTAAVGQLLKTGLARNADEALDILTKGFQSGANKADDLLDTFTEYGTQFRKFGLDGATATGLLSQGLKAGARDADTVADALKEFSIRAVDGSKTSVAGYEALGLSANKMAAQIAKGGPAAKQGLDTVLDRLRAVKDPLKQSQIAVQLFGTKAEDLGQALFKLDPSSAVKALGNVSGAADKMAKTLHDNPAAALEKFKRTATAKLAEVGGGIVQWAMQNQNIVQPLAIGLGVVAAAMVAVRIAQAAWTTIQVVATAAQWAYNAALSANPIGLIIIAVIALVAGIVLLWKKNETFRKVVTAAWQAIWGVVKAVGKWFANTLWPWMKGAFSKIGSGASAVW
ncbi:phage tail tape measure protein, partial [Actinocorallia libanotica]|uniref:phage tail tape measure protein n=1 Tax=Actinocorallia libanotica TaxID=46162 RepID=UPI0031CFC299